LNEGIALYGLGRLHEAIDAYALVQHCVNPVVGVMFTSLFTNWAPAQAIGNNEAMAQDGLVNMGAAYHMLGKFDEVVYLHTVSPVGRRDDKHCNEWFQAIALYKRALERNPNDGRAYNNLGAILSIQAKDEESFNVLSKSLQLDPFGESTLVNLASYHTVSCGLPALFVPGRGPRK
jgi:tetratricopeptide (TPR) repeat protein